MWYSLHTFILYPSSFCFCYSKKCPLFSHLYDFTHILLMLWLFLEINIYEEMWRFGNYHFKKVWNMFGFKITYCLPPYNWFALLLFSISHFSFLVSAKYGRKDSKMFSILILKMKGKKKEIHFTHFNAYLVLWTISYKCNNMYQPILQEILMQHCVINL